MFNYEIFNIKSTENVINQTTGKISTYATTKYSKITFEQISEFNYITSGLCSFDDIMLNKNPYGLEAGPFDGIVEDVSGGLSDVEVQDGPDSFEEITDDTSWQEEDNSTSSDNTGDENSDGNNQDVNEPKQLDRAKVIKDNFELNKTIRQLIPKNFQKLQESVKTNINIVESYNDGDKRVQEVLNRIIDQYEKISEFLIEYFKIMPEQTYDQMFTTYMQVFSDCYKLRKAYIIAVKGKDAHKELLNNLFINKSYNPKAKDHNEKQ